MKRLFIIPLLLAAFISYGQPPKGEVGKLASTPSDLRAEINQSAFDKILASMDIPLLLFEHRNPFPKASAAIQETDDLEEFDKSYGYDELQSLFSWAVNGLNTSLAEPTDLTLKKELKNAWLNSLEEVNEVVENYENAVKNQTTPGYKGPLPTDFKGGDISIEMLKKWQTASVKEVFTNLNTMTSVAKVEFARAHLAYAKAELYDRPILTVNSPNFKTTNIRVKVSATGELWLKVPRFRCCRRVFGICVWVCLDRWEWVRVASVSPSVKIGSDISVNFEIQNRKIFGSGLFDRLFLDYFILRDINLAGIANRYLQNKKFELYDASAFVASLPYINKNFRIQNIRLPVRTGGVTVEIDIVNK